MTTPTAPIIAAGEFLVQERAVGVAEAAELHVLRRWRVVLNGDGHEVRYVASTVDPESGQTRWHCSCLLPRDLAPTVEPEGAWCLHVAAVREATAGSTST